MKKCLVTYLLSFMFINLNGQKGILPDTVAYCTGDSIYLEVKQQFGNTASINWTTPYNIITNTKRIKASMQGKYYVKVTSPQFFNPIYDSTYVKVSSRPRLRLRDTALCKGKSVILDARNPGMRYLWSNGETAQRIKAEGPAKYWVKISNGSCQLIDTVVIRQLQGAPVVVNPEVVFCLKEDNKYISIKAGPGTRYLWNTGATTAGIVVNREGAYWVKTESSQCGSQTDTIHVKLKVCECEMMIPNSFTPNEDGRNDYFFPVAQCEYSYYTMTITDRWGNVVFSSNSINTRWDGRFKGNLCPEDIYVYRIESTEKGSDKKLVRSGHISLFR